MLYKKTSNHNKSTCLKTKNNIKKKKKKKKNNKTSILMLNIMQISS